MLLLNISCGFRTTITKTKDTERRLGQDIAIMMLKVKKTSPKLEVMNNVHLGVNVVDPTRKKLLMRRRKCPTVMMNMLFNGSAKKSKCVNDTVKSRKKLKVIFNDKIAKNQK
jgi:hypothetical protein